MSGTAAETLQAGHDAGKAGLRVSTKTAGLIDAPCASQS